MKDQRLEVVNQQDSNFVSTLELAVRFGKTLLVQEVKEIEPVMFSVLRGDITTQGLRATINIGDKTVDFNPEFRMFLATRDPSLSLPPFAQSLVTEVNFTTTRAGLTGQLLAATIQHEKPELEQKKSELLKKEDEMKIQLDQLEEAILRELAQAKGNILQNTELLDSLNRTKESARTVEEALVESHRLQATLDVERNSFLPFAEAGSRLYFLIQDLFHLNPMYRFSLNSFFSLFKRSLSESSDRGGDKDGRINDLTVALQRLVYQYYGKSLFKADRLAFGLHLSHGMRPDIFTKEEEWEFFLGRFVAAGHDEGGSRSDAPGWVPVERQQAVSNLKAALPDLSHALQLSQDGNSWQQFMSHPNAEQALPGSLNKKLTPLQQLIVIQALRPDRLVSAMTNVVCRSLALKELTPSGAALKHAPQQSTGPQEPILVLLSPGADPSQELQELAAQTVGPDNYFQVAMGQGQQDEAMQLLSSCSREGQWLCLKNLHLMTPWLSQLEKELVTLKPHPNFKLWLTTEPHMKFPTILLQSSLKVTYEAPPGIRQNLLRTYESWTPDFIQRGGQPQRAQSLFTLAWFHAVCEERRTYIPQGWTKFYEFNLADLRAGADLLDRMFAKSQDLEAMWPFIHGLYENAIYGGRVDNVFDLRILRSYLEDDFNSQVLGSRGDVTLGPCKIPHSINHRDFVKAIEQLPETDSPSYFGLPENIDQSLQRNISGKVQTQLRSMSQAEEKSVKFDKHVWGTELSPLLNLWKRLNQPVNLVQLKPQVPSVQSGGKDPVVSFLHLERYNALKLVQTIHQSLASLSRSIRGQQLLTNDVHKLATSLLARETPSSWLDKWAGPEEPAQFLSAIASRTVAVVKLTDSIGNDTSSARILNDVIDLSALFNPGTFLNALRQAAARQSKTAMDELKIQVICCCPFIHSFIHSFIHLF